MRGMLIAGMGLPGVGKSSVLKALADSLIRRSVAATLYCEPEESGWPDAVQCRDQCGYITALTWFRSSRVPMLYHAAKDREEGRIAIVDSYYDKLIHLYLNDANFSWLIPQGDPYRPIYQQLAKRDFEALPDADCVVTFTVKEDRWREFVRGRGRDLDRNSKILDSYGMQPVLLKASADYAASKSIPHVIFENSLSPVASAADALLAELSSLGIVSVTL